MTKEGRLARGKLNFEANMFLQNSETLEYMASLKNKPEVKKDAKPNK